LERIFLVMLPHIPSPPHSSYLIFNCIASCLYTHLWHMVIHFLENMDCTFFSPKVPTELVLHGIGMWGQSEVMSEFILTQTCNVYFQVY
jgi:hypothetical protein